jgi:hypothetical protein
VTVWQVFWSLTILAGFTLAAFALPWEIGVQAEKELRADMPYDWETEEAL